MRRLAAVLVIPGLVFLWLCAFVVKSDAQFNDVTVSTAVRPEVTVSTAVRPVLPVDITGAEKVRIALATLNDRNQSDAGLSASTNCQNFAYHGKTAVHDLLFAAAGEGGGGDIRGAQLAGSCKHAVGVCDDGGKTGGGADGAA
jgi:hypothetical protein